jgi:predicted O-methyltransferase YrrM
MPTAQFRLGRQDGAPDVFIATPSGSGSPHGNYVMALADTFAELGKRDIAADYWLHCGDCHVDDARNFLVRQFMDSHAPVMVFIDDDVGWDAESFLKLISHKDADIVGGAYPLKQDTEDYPVRVIEAREMLQARPDGLLEVEGVPTGFMVIRRHVLEKMCERRKHMKFWQRGFPKEERRHQVIFERTLVDGNRWSGDLNFCREARLAGFKVFVDPEMPFTHEGKKRWRGHLGNWLRQQNGILNPKLDDALKQLALGDASLENFQKIRQENNNQYTAGSDMLKKCYEMAQATAGPILEVGSGLSTLAMGMAVQRTGQIIHTLEHELDWFRAMRNFIKLYSLRPVHLYHAPLKEHNGESLMWYEISEHLPAKFSLVVIDGPPRRFGREGVYKLLWDRIKDADWIIDDMDDPGQRAMVEKYAKEAGKKVWLSGPIGPMRAFAVCTTDQSASA